jgi:alpha-glucosidase (family GH31 glycosyl hydrolase)
MVDELHRRGVKVLLWQIPLQKMQPPPRGQAAADAARMIRDGYGIREAGGRPYRNRGWWFPQALMPDFTNPDARAWWLSKRRYLVEEIGIDGFKTDGGEHAWGHDLRYHDGTDGSASNNRYPVEYAHAYHDLLTAAGKPPVTFSRAGFTGAQAYACQWAGDENSTWAAFRASIVAGLTAGLCGITYWGWDLAGFSGDVPDPELYLRAAQASCFMPIMQYHSEFNFHRLPSRDRTPWNIADRSGRPEVVGEFRQWAELRERLVPYLHEQTHLGIRAGLPLMRAMALEAPGDPRVWDYPLQFFCGTDLLVAPVTEPGTDSIEVYLPAGDWIDLCTGSRQASGPVLRQTPLGEVAVFVRADAWPRFESVRRGFDG